MLTASSLTLAGDLTASRPAGTTSSPRISSRTASACRTCGPTAPAGRKLFPQNPRRLEIESLKQIKGFQAFLARAGARLLTFKDVTSLEDHPDGRRFWVNYAAGKTGGLKTMRRLEHIAQRSAAIIASSHDMEPRC